MKKRLLSGLCIGLLSLSLFPATAQESDCNINLTADISALVMAQDDLRQDKTEIALQKIDQVQQNLSDMLASCETGQVTLSRVLNFQPYEFRISYPDTWVSQSPVSGIYVLGASLETVTSIVESNVSVPLPSGAGIVIAAYGSMEDLYNVDDIQDMLSMLQDDGLSRELRFKWKQTDDSGNYPVHALTIESTFYDGTAYIMDTKDENVLLFIGLTPKGEFSGFEKIFEAIFASATNDKSISGLELTPASQPLPKYTGAQPVADVIGNNNSRYGTLSPDGTRIAWFQRESSLSEICIFTFADSTTDCHANEDFKSNPPILLWSPDSRYIAFTENGLQYFHEADIHILDTETNQYANLTDDGADSVLITDKNITTVVWFDYAFTWGADNQIYFVRQEMLPDDDEGMFALYRISPEGGEAEYLRNLGEYFTKYSIYQPSMYDLNGAIAVSPDASQVAFIVAESNPRSEKNGVWVMSLVDDTAPYQVAITSTLKAGLPQGSEESNSVMPFSLAWTADETGLFLRTSDIQSTLSVTLIYHIDLKTTDIHPLIDFSHLTRSEFLEIIDGRSARFDVPLTAVMSPDKSSLLTLHREKDTLGLAAFIPSQTTYEKTMLTEYKGNLPVSLISTGASDGKLLLMGMLFVPQN